MTAQTIIGIDPGAHGAIAVLNENGDLLEVVDMPSTPEANGRTATNAPLLAGILARVGGLRHIYFLLWWQLPQLRRGLRSIDEMPQP